MSAFSTFTSLRSSSSAPSVLARASRSGTSSMAMTRLAFITSADWIANRPTGPQPQTATVSFGPISAKAAACQPVGRISDRKMYCSSDPVLGTLTSVVAAKGTRIYSACPPA